MSTVLVVDDSAVDRRLVGGLLQRGPGLRVEYAENGREALVKIGTLAPDLVVTDLQMPEMDGLELVSRMKEEYPQIPVVLVTGHGSEETAVAALRQGAASYVPKRLLAEELVDTVENVLAVAAEHKDQTRVLGHLEKNEIVFVLGTDDTLFPPLVHFLQEVLLQTGVCDPTENLQVGVALDEALTNALYHGNLEIGSQLRETSLPEYFETARRRKTEAPYRDRKIRVEARLSQDAALIRLRDEGPGFDPAGLPDPTDPENLDAVHGRGIFLMRTFMDSVEFNEKGNEVTMIKRRSSRRPRRGEGD